VLAKEQQTIVEDFPHQQQLVIAPYWCVLLARWRDGGQIVSPEQLVVDLLCSFAITVEITVD
jgi:hypothetical protein